MLTIPMVEINIEPEWVSAICNILLLFLTAVSVYYAFRAYRHQKERSKKEAACNLAKHYASNIIDKYADITSVFDAAGITEEVRKTLPIREIREFDREELDRLLKKGNMTIEEFEAKLLAIDPMAILNAQMNRACSPEERRHTFESYTKLDEEGKLQIINASFLMVDFEHEICGLLNELEWFAMNCKYGIADEELMYQSLHQTYISTVWMLYYYVSHANINNEDKLFTNLTWLFNVWRDRLIEITDNTEAKKQALISMANSVKSKVYEGSRLK